jgi:hypothetical protein
MDPARVKSWIENSPGMAYVDLSPDYWLETFDWWMPVLNTEPQTAD